MCRCIFVTGRMFHVLDECIFQVQAATVNGNKGMSKASILELIHSKPMTGKIKLLL
jgi:hypothetical protein